jgi:hypothetical protein
MKRILVVVAVVIVALVIFGAGFAFAQYQSVSAAGYGPSMMGRGYPQGGTPVPGQTYGPGGMMGGRGGRGGYGVAHDYVEEALAAKLGITEEKVEEQLAAGKTMAQIALDNGVAEADLQTVFAEVHKTALDKAVAAGVMTQAQADEMLQNMQEMPYLNGSQGYGRGGMMGGRGGRGGNGGYGLMQNYVEQALADKLGLTEAKVEEQLAAGKTMAQVALDNGIAEADLPTVFAEIHKTAFDKAVEAGVMTQEQADLMLQNMQNHWDDGMPCLDGTQTGQNYGPGGMMGGRSGGRGNRWNQAPQTNP